MNRVSRRSEPRHSAAHSKGSDAFIGTSKSEFAMPGTSSLDYGFHIGARVKSKYPNSMLQPRHVPCQPGRIEYWALDAHAPIVPPQRGAHRRHAAETDADATGHGRF